ncbi:hypothetical protein ACHAQH_002331 [Verticillium albo-atrum]
MSSSAPVSSYTTTLPFKDIKISNIPESSPSPAQDLIIALNRPERHNAVTDNLLNGSKRLTSWSIGTSGGLFSKLLPTPQETVAYAVELASEIAENTSLTSTKLMRDMLLHTPATLEETHRLDSKVFISILGSKDNLAGIKSFMKKQKPEFSGSFDRDAVSCWPWWATPTDMAAKANM